MSEEHDRGTYPAGTGWVSGYLLGAAFGTLAWVISREVAVAAIVLVITGTSLGLALEHSMDARPFTRRQRLFAVSLGATGFVGALIVLTYLFLYA